MAIRSLRYEPSVLIPQRSLCDYGKKIQVLGHCDHGIYEYQTEASAEPNRLLLRR